ncbi:hypothetical protein C0J52_06049 [Blattella germanica]|nr:hypothetical protein C0J52_06049 [Blattella germanica]
MVDDHAKGGEEQDAQAQEQVAILKQINRVNDDGSYTFGYEAADGSFKIETRDVLGNVKGMFGFIDEGGELKRVSYSASNKTGFQSTGTLAPGTEATPTSSATPPLLYQQIIRPAQATTRRPILRPRETLGTTTPRSPVLLYAQSLSPAAEGPEVSTRSPVIQSIPRSRRPLEIPGSTERPLVSSTTTRRPLHLYGQYIRQHPGFPGGHPVKQIFVTPAPVDEVSSERPDVSSPRTTGVIYGHYIRPTQAPEVPTASGQLLRRVVLARRPSSDVPTSTEAALLHAKQAQDHKDEERREGLKGNALRRQLSPQDRGVPQLIRARQSGTDDTGDVYGGSLGGSPRPIPSTPFRSLFTPNQPRAAQSAVLQSQLLQGIPGARPGPPGYPQDDLGPRVPPGAIPSGVGGSIRIPLGVIRGGTLDPRVPPGSFQYTPPPGYQYVPPQGPDPDLQEQLLQLLLGRQQARQPPVYVNDYHQYRQQQQGPMQQLTPFQLALMMTLGENIPPELLDDPYHQRQQPPYSPQQMPYPRQQVPYAVPYSPQQPGASYPAQQPGPPYPAQQPGTPYSGQQPGYPPQGAGPYGQQIPYSPYDPQQSPLYNPQYQQPYPLNYPGQNPYHIPYHLRRRLRYRPQPVYPYPNGPDYYQQPYQGRNSPVGYPQEYLPDEYRDALILRMLLAVRAAQQGRGIPRPIDQNPNIQERSQQYLATDGSTTSTTTVRPRTLAPVRNVQILDPVTEETTAKRSTDKPLLRS